MDFVASGPAVIALATAGWVVSMAAFYGAGIGLARRAFPLAGAGERAVRTALAFAFGMLFYSLAVFFLGHFGLLRPSLLAGILAFGAALCVRALGNRPALPRLSAADAAFFFTVAMLSVVTFVAAQAPEIGNDSMSYHLYFPKLHAEAGRLAHDPFHARSLWPAMMGMLFAMGLVLQGVALAKLYAWTAAPLLLLAAWGIARSRFGVREARVALVFVAAVPALWQQSAYAYVDIPIALYAILAYATLERWLERGCAKTEGVAAGLCLGALVSIKLFSLITALVFAAVYVPAALARHGRRAWGASGAVALVSGAAASVWYVRSWSLTGNPVFPFLGSIFGGNGFTQKMVGWSVLPKDPLHFALVPWNTAMRPDVYGGEPVGFLFLAALPFLWKAPARDAAWRRAAAFTLLYVAAWFLGLQLNRFLIPVIAFAAIVLAPGVAAAEFASRTAKAVCFAALGALAALQAAQSAYYPARMLGGATGAVNASSYLNDRERTYGFFTKTGPLLPPETRVLSVGEPRFFYAPWRMVLYSPLIEREAERSNRTIGQWLEASCIRHVLTSGADTFIKPPFGGEWKQLALGITREGDQVFHYALWESRTLPKAS